jgi:hypothetical protein
MKIVLIVVFSKKFAYSASTLNSASDDIEVARIKKNFFIEGHGISYRCKEAGEK